MRAVLVAPYTPPGTHSSPHLGGSSKIRSIGRILAAICDEVVLVNSAHNESSLGRPRKGVTDFGEGVRVETVTPSTLPVRAAGKLLNLAETCSLAKRLASRQVDLVWIYNGYAFEAKLANELLALTNSRFVLEIEDSLFARRRGFFNLKPRLDDLFLKRVIEKCSLITCVNDVVQKDVRRLNSSTMLLPYILNPSLERMVRSTSIFSKETYTVGYFGGLTVEKGADLLSKVLPSLPDGWRLVVTGVGPLANELHAAAETDPARMIFLENAPEAEMLRLMSECDVILNPHKPIQAMANGVFPYKVFEAISAGALLITTELPDCGLNLSKASIFFDGTPAGLVCALRQADEFYERHKREHEALREAISVQYSETALANRLARAIFAQGQAS